MTEENLARLNSLLSKQITNLEHNLLTDWEDKYNLSIIIMNLCNAITSLQYALEAEKGEGWRND